MTNFGWRHMNNHVSNKILGAYEIPVVKSLNKDPFILNSSKIQEILSGISKKYGPLDIGVINEMDTSCQAVISLLNNPNINYRELSDKEFRNIFFSIFDEREFSAFCDVHLQEIKSWTPSINTHENRVNAVKGCIKKYCEKQRKNIGEQEKIPSYKQYKLTLLNMFEKRLTEELRKQSVSI